MGIMSLVRRCLLLLRWRLGGTRSAIRFRVGAVTLGAGLAPASGGLCGSLLAAGGACGQVLGAT